MCDPAKDRQAYELELEAHLWKAARLKRKGQEA